MSDILEIQQGEGKWIRFTVTRDGAPLPLTSAVLFFGMKEAIGDDEYIYKIEDTDPGWDKTGAALGVVRANIPVSVTTTLKIQKYEAQARFILTANTDVDKTQRLAIKIKAPVIKDPA